MEAMTAQQAPQMQLNPQYQTQTPLVQMSDWLLSNPTIPLNFKKEFYVLWEIAVFGNYSELDIKRLMLDFEEWTIFKKWSTPDHQWGNLLEYQSVDNVSVDADNTVKELMSKDIVLDMNLLFNILRQLYFIQLSRGKNGFTLKEINSVRSIFNNASEEEPTKKKKISLF